MPRKLMKSERSPRIRVHVTQEDIETAIPKDSGHCMIADALKRAVPHARSVSVDVQTIRYSDPALGLRYTYLTPRSAQAALIDFDYEVPPSPFAFELRTPQITETSDAKMRRLAERRRARENGEPLPEPPQTRLIPDAEAPGSVPQRVGGKTPPVASLSNLNKSNRGKRREFGLRGFKPRSQDVVDG